MKTLILNGSPRPNGDTAGLLRLLKEDLAGEYRQVDAYRASISPCVDCRFCKTRSGCAIQDEMQEIYSYIQDCDNILIASPMYFSELTGKLLDVGSRLQAYYSARHFRRETPILKPKRGAVLLVGGGDGSPEKAEETARVLLHFMNCHNVHPLVCSHDTDRCPAIRDPRAAAGVRRIAAFFNGEE
jgi:multimeric flavodoxin WrbA